VATVAAAVTVISTTTFAAGDVSAPARSKILQRISEKLNLTDDQKTQIKTVFAGEKDTLVSLVSRLHEARKDLREAIHAGSATEASVRSASATVASAEADLAVERMKLYGKIAPILTDEQRQKISQFEQRVDDFAENILARLGNGSDL